MRIYKLLTSFFLCFTLVSSAIQSEENTHFSIFIASYNNATIARQNILSAALQNYDNFHIYYVNDCSTDNTEQVIVNTLNEIGKSHLVTLISNETRKGAMRNQYEVVHTYIPDDSVIVILDGDDFLAHQDVLNVLNRVYSNPNKEIWMTYGQFKGLQSNQIGFNLPFPTEVVVEHAFRDYVHLPSHLRTYYSWIFKEIKLDDLCFNGDFYTSTCDLAVMLPIVEMAAEGHFEFIPEVLYLYNEDNPISDHRVDADLQMELCDYIRSLPSYAPIASRQ